MTTTEKLERISARCRELLKSHEGVDGYYTARANAGWRSTLMPHLQSAENDCWSLVDNLTKASKASKAGEATDDATQRALDQAIKAAKDLTETVETLRYNDEVK